MDAYKVTGLENVDVLDVWIIERAMGRGKPVRIRFRGDRNEAEAEAERLTKAARDTGFN